jgi:hypothetical protein
LAPWLSSDWAREAEAATSALPPLDGVTASVALAIGVARRQEVRVSWCYLDGKASPGSGSAADGADLELSISADDAADLFTGAVEPSVAFMRGRLKASGDGSVLLGFLASTSSAGFGTWREEALALADPASRPTLSR